MNPKGYRIVCDVWVTNDNFLKYRTPEFVFHRDGEKTCTFKTYDGTSLLIGADRFMAVVEPLDSSEAAEAYAGQFEQSLKFYLARSGIACRISCSIIDLAETSSRLLGSAKMSLAVPFEFGDLIGSVNARAQQAIDLLVKAETLSEELRMILYIFTLESLLEEGEKGKRKPENVILALDDLIKRTAAYDLEDHQKEALIVCLENHKEVGSRNAIKKMIRHYCPARKTCCKGTEKKYTDIFQKCYNMRNDYVHKGEIHQDLHHYISALNKVAYDVVFAYATDPAHRPEGFLRTE